MTVAPHARALAARDDTRPCHNRSNEQNTVPNTRRVPSTSCPRAARRTRVLCARVFSTDTTRALRRNNITVTFFSYTNFPYENGFLKNSTPIRPSEFGCIVLVFFFFFCPQFPYAQSSKRLENRKKKMDYFPDSFWYKRHPNLRKKKTRLGTIYIYISG